MPYSPIVSRVFHHPHRSSLSKTAPEQKSEKGWLMTATSRLVKKKSKAVLLSLGLNPVSHTHTYTYISVHTNRIQKGA